MTKSDKSWICIQTSPNGPFDCLVERVRIVLCCVCGLYIVMINIGRCVSMEWNGMEWNGMEWNVVQREVSIVSL
jgi:hypothetical protein